MRSQVVLVLLLAMVCMNVVLLCMLVGTRRAVRCVLRMLGVVPWLPCSVGVRIGALVSIVGAVLDSVVACMWQAAVHRLMHHSMVLWHVLQHPLVCLAVLCMLCGRLGRHMMALHSTHRLQH